MGTKFRAVEGEVGAVNTLTSLTTFGSETKGPIKVPAGSSHISRIVLTAGINIDTSADQGAIGVRLTGDGMKEDQDIVFAGVGNQTATIASTTIGPHDLVLDDLRMEVNPNEEITVQAMAVGDDVLIATVGVTLQFE